VSNSESFFDSLELLLVPVGLGSFGVNLLEVLTELLLLTVSLLSLQLMVELGLDLGHTLLLHLLPEEETLQL